MEITERLLNDAGGWQIMKQAKALHEMGRVAEAAWAPPLLQGRVREGETEFRAGLRILSKTNIENLCRCRASRQHGAICAHSVAVGLAWLRPPVVLPSAATVAPAPAADAGAAKPSPPAMSAGKPAFSAEAGLPIELHVILPPNFAPAWTRGNLTVGVEAIVGSKRMLLPALDRNTAYRAGEEDLRLIGHLRQLAEGALPGVLALAPERMLGLLGALAGHPRVFFGKTAPVRIAVEPLRPSLKVEQGTNGDLRLQAALPAGALLLRGGAAQPWLLEGASFRVVAPGLAAPYHELLEREIVVPAAGAAGFLQQEWAALGRSFDLPEAPAASTSGSGRAAPSVHFYLELEGSLNFLAAKLQARYGEERVTLTGRPARSRFSRDLAAEQAALAKLQAAGFSAPDAEGQLMLKGEPRILAFFARDLQQWEREATVTIGERFQHVTQGVERIRPRLEVRSSGEDWFELRVELTSGSGERYSGAEIQRLLQGGQSHVRNRHGRLAVFDPGAIDELQQALRDCEPAQGEPGSYRVQNRHAAFLQAIAEEQGAELVAAAPWRQAARGLAGLAEPPAVPLGSLAGTLRPYQIHGVNWMAYLARNGFAGILADEMGLGKTLQALAALRALGGKGLIVCPSSLIYNWEREAGRWTPERRVLAIAGGGRQARFGQPMAEADLVITSYALLRRDAELYRPYEFTTVVLDEAQHIKNPETQNAQAAFGIRGRHRFVLTGTPVENSVRDLWSLMHFLMPGYLGSREDFCERYEKPISEDPGGAEQRRLAKRLQPFILRRRKKEVVKELPEKIEQVAYCELTTAQRAVYTELLRASKRQVSELSGGQDQNRARMIMLTTLLRLRQACCDPRLLQLEPPSSPEDSSKLELFGELLQEMVDGGHRVLVFSQFVGMLHLLRDWLGEQGIDHCYLDGATRNRGAEVDRFQQGAAPVFLISLKAGGVGLNLTVADTVVHFDPWWNPAVEAQATDRAHRIGQTNVVTSYKLIARDTVEEKILHLQEKKRRIIDATIESEEPMMQGLTTEDLQELLE